MTYLNYTDSSFLFLIGPSIYFYFTFITEPLILSKREILLHSIPFLFSIFIVLLIDIFHPSFLTWTIESNLFYLKQTGNVYISSVIALSYVSILFYLIITFKKLYIHFLGKTEAVGKKAILIFLLTSIFFSGFLNIANVFSSFYIIVGYAAFSFMPLFFILLSVRYPEISMSVHQDSRKTRYKNKLKSEYNDSNIINRLNAIMIKEKPYNREDISLATLSSSLLITSHELSRILNENFRQNFNTYINHYRVKEAQRLFTENSEISIAEVGYATGFKSKSSFYHNFVKITGITPGEYIKNHS